jgi:platelet-activating factor acetylhydrolase IB subunit alpha
VKLWDALQGQCLMTFAAHENWVRCVTFHPSFKFIISCSDDKTIRIMDIKVWLVV